MFCLVPEKLSKKQAGLAQYKFFIKGKLRTVQEWLRMGKLKANEGWNTLGARESSSQEST